MDGKNISKDKKLDALLGQYSELCDDSRHYDQKLWIIQSAAYTTTAFFYVAIFDTSKYGLDVRLVLAAVNVIIFAGFLFQYVKDRAFQLANQDAIRQILAQIPGTVSINQYSGALGTDKRDKWFIRIFKKRSAANFVFYVMLIILTTHVGVVVFLGLEFLKVLK